MRGRVSSFSACKAFVCKAGAGLIKKFYLHKEHQNERYCILDFNIKDFKKIAKGENMLQLMSEKLLSLQLDTDYSTYLSKHPAES